MLVLACLRKVPGGTLQTLPSSSPLACFPFGEWDGIFLPVQARRDLRLRGVRSPGNTARAITRVARAMAPPTFVLVIGLFAWSVNTRAFPCYK